jgi:sugar lactone lactonase YvrE
VAVSRLWPELPPPNPDGQLDRPGGEIACLSGEVLETIDLDRGCFACALGGPDGTTLFMMTADFSDPRGMMSGEVRTGQILTAEAPAEGAGWS